MKNSIIIAAFALGAFVFGTNQAQAQDPTATTTVNITLADVISIDAGSIPNGGTVNFAYNSAEDYNSSQDYTIENSLIVTSTKNFDVKVKADGEFFTDGTNNIPVNVLTIKAVSGGTMAGTQNTIELSNSDQKLIDNAPLGSALTLDLNYQIPAEKSRSSDILGKPAGTYTQTVTYTATAL